MSNRKSAETDFSNKTPSFTTKIRNILRNSLSSDPRVFNFDEEVIEELRRYNNNIFKNFYFVDWLNFVIETVKLMFLQIIKIHRQ